MSMATNRTQGTRNPANEKPQSIVRSVLFICCPLSTLENWSYVRARRMRKVLQVRKYAPRKHGVSDLNPSRRQRSGGPVPILMFFFSLEQQTMRGYHCLNSLRSEKKGAPSSVCEGGDFGVRCRRD